MEPVQPNPIQLKRKVSQRCIARAAQRSRTHTEIWEAVISTSLTPKSATGRSAISTTLALRASNHTSRATDGCFSACALAFGKKLRSAKYLASSPDLQHVNDAGRSGDEVSVSHVISIFLVNANVCTCVHASNIQSVKLLDILCYCVSLSSTLGKTTISNDGATIMKLLDVVHPAAKTLVDISLSQDAEVCLCTSVCECVWVCVHVCEVCCARVRVYLGWGAWGR